jgi:hypothetical protein
MRGDFEDHLIKSASAQIVVTKTAIKELREQCAATRETIAHSRALLRRLDNPTPTLTASAQHLSGPSNDPDLQGRSACYRRADELTSGAAAGGTLLPATPTGMRRT